MVTVVVKRTEHLGSFLHGESPVTVVMDPVLYGSPVHDRLQAASFLSGADWFDLPEDGGGMKAARAVADRVPAGGWCLALGGGTTIDTVKVARIISALAPLQGLLAGEVLVDESTSESLPWRIVALPTTIGTASEVSSVAVVCCGGGRILLRGSGLRPEVACLDPMQTQTLPSAAIVSGAVEALFRTVFPYLASPTTPSQDSAVHAIAASLLCYIRAELVAPLPAKARKRLAELSQCSQTAGLHRGRDPHGFKLWPINHEVSTLTGQPKIMTMSALAPRIIEQIEQGGAVWGSMRVLDDLMDDLDPLLPAGGGAAGRWKSLMEECSLPTVLPAIDVEDAVRLVMNRWGAPRPALAGVERRDVHNLLSASLEGDEA